MKNIVYLTTNKINGKKYVGSHIEKSSNDNYLGSGKYFKRALQKYGFDNFSREILEECNSIEEARLLEEQYIREFNTLDPDGYNISPKGGLGYMGSHSDCTRKKLGRNMKGENNPMFGRNHSERARTRMSKIRKGIIPINIEILHSAASREKISKTLSEKFSAGILENGMTGKKHSAEAIEKIRLSAKNQNRKRNEIHIYR
jgi:group I intron endonuclease